MSKILYELNSKEELEELITKTLRNVVSDLNTSRIDQGNELLTTEELCSWLKISRVQVWHLSKKGIVPFIRIGNQKRFLKSDVLKKLKSFQR